MTLFSDRRKTLSGPLCQKRMGRAEKALTQGPPATELTTRSQARLRARRKKHTFLYHLPSCGRMWTRKRIYTFFLTRRNLHLPESNGLNTSTPASRKSLVFRVTIRKRWTHAVAANNPSTRVQKPGHPAISYTSVLNCGLAPEGRIERSDCVCLQAAPFVAPSTSYRATEKALRHPDVQLAEIVPEIPPIPGQKPVRMNSGVGAN